MMNNKSTITSEELQKITSEMLTKYLQAHGWEYLCFTCYKQGGKW